MVQPGHVEFDGGRILAWIVDTNLLDELAIAGATLISGNNTIMGRLFASAAGESKSNGHCAFLVCSS
jgi:hypothetical protein